MMSASFTRLVWKDALLVKTLLLIVALVIVVGNLALVVSFLVDPQHFSADTASQLAMLGWMLLPNLVAFGIPALLIGTEEESGTLAWLRTLPIPRGNVIYSKLLVALGAVVRVWIGCSVALFAVSLITGPLDIYNRNGDIESLELFSVYVSLLLLLIGFVTSYAFRSPITAMVVVLPITLVCIVVFSVVIAESNRSGWRDGIWLPYSIAGGFLVVLVVLQHRLALRRLRPVRLATDTSQSDFSLMDTVHFSAEQSETSYCLNLQLRLPILRLVQSVTKQNLLTRPSQTRALLWQAASQQAAPTTSLTIFVLAATVGCQLAKNNWNAIFPIMGMSIVLDMCWLGSLTFYSDTLRRRHLYFAERGLSRNRVWLTRMAIPSAAIVVIATFVWLVFPDHSYDLDFVHISTVIGCVAFAIGSLVSMMATRPVLGLIVSPTLVVMSLMLSSTLFNYYADYLPSILLAAIPILFATWRLLPRWSRGRRGIGFDARVAGYLLLGPLLVCVYLFGHRIVTTPAEMPEWRAARFAELVEIPESDNYPIGEYETALQVFNKPRNYEDTESALPAATYLIEVTRDCREAIVRGELHPSVLTKIEQGEASVLAQIKYGIYLEDAASYRSRILAALASDSLRRDSRRAALISDWRSYQSQSWRDTKLPGMPYAPKTFGGVTVAWQHYAYSFDRLRADRFVDAATKATLEYIESDAVQPTDETVQRLQALWCNAFDVPSVYAEAALPISLQADLWIAELRKREN